jgi:superfamily II DNA or RNA helicase
LLIKNNIIAKKKNIRDTRQSEAVKAFKKGGILLASPRFGKTKVCLETLKGKNILIIIPNNDLKIGWKNEIEKWKFKGTYKILNKSSIKKITNDYDAILIDEIDTLSPANIKGLKKYKKILYGCTGSLGEKSQEALSKELGMNIVYEYSIEQAVTEGVIADYRIYVHPVDLDKTDSYVEIGKWTTTEEKSYEYWTKKLKEVSAKIANSYSNPYNSFNMRQLIQDRMRLGLMRSQYISRYLSKLKKAKEIVDSLDRCIIFTSRTDRADYLGNGYHSKSKDVLDKFLSGKLSNIAVCKYLSRGFTDPTLKKAVIHHLTSSQEDAIQKILRTMNLDPEGNVAEIHVCTYRNTKDTDWTTNALKLFNQDKVIWLDK